MRNMTTRMSRPQSPSAADLTQMQVYLGEETIEDFEDGLISRRAMLKRLIIVCGGSAAAAALLSACGVPVNAPPTSTAAPAAPTQAPTSAPAVQPTAAPTQAIAPTSTPEAAAAAPTATGAAATAAATAPGASGSKSPLAVAPDSPDVQAADVTFSGDTELMGYLARPAAPGTYPGVIVIHENRGLTDHIKDVTRRLAKAGYIALAPDLVSRNGGTAKVSRDQVVGFLGQTAPEDLIKDLNAGVAFLTAQTGIKSEKVGVVGFCFGGAYTLRLAAANPNVAAAVCYYGVTPQPASQMAQTNAAVLGQYGERDQRVNNTIADLESTLLGAGKTFEKRIYAGAGHAFNNDTGANWNEAAAVEAWQTTLAWFAKHL